MNATPHAVAERLAAGPPRGLGCANAIAREALTVPAALSGLIAALEDSRPVVTIRAANALNKIGKARPDLLAPHARALLRAAGECTDLRTRWNLILVLGALPLRGRERALAVELLFEALGSESGFLRAFALTGLTNLARGDEALRRRVRPIVLNALEDRSAAMRARARTLARLLDAGSPASQLCRSS